MDAYIYKAALWCEDCAQTLTNKLPKHDDSDHYPQGPYVNGGGEADNPEYCYLCNRFLKNPLTDEGNKFVYETLMEFAATLSPDYDWSRLQEWREFYGYLFSGKDK